MRHDLKALIVLFKAHQHVLNNVKNTLEDEPLNLSEFTVLEALNSKGQLTTHALINTVLIPNSSMTYVLDNLEKKGYLVRFKSKKDRRIQQLEITPEGKALFTTIYESHFNQMRTLFDCLTEQEEETLISSLKKLGKEAQRRISNESSSK